MSLFAATLSFTIAFLGALILSPLIARLARRWSLVDQPDGNRKGHLQATPLGGGVAVAGAITAAVIGAIAWDAPTDFAGAAGPYLRGFLPGAIVLLVVGLIDDVLGITGIYKLIGQVMAATLLVAGGFRFDLLGVFGWPMVLGDFSIPFTIFFLLGAINAFNLIDGSDALAASVGAVVSLTLGVIAGAQGDPVSSVLCFACAGALTGFLPFNMPPARMFLGDTGSMLIGLIVAAVAVHCSIKRQAAVALAVPLAICAIPILDATAALVRRITTGQSVFTPDRGHLHHALLHRGWSAARTAAFIAGLTAITCSGALASYFTRHEVYAIVAGVGVVAALAATRVFGHAEARLLATHAASAFRSAYNRGTRQPAGPGVEKSIQIHGQRRWEMIWSALRESAPAQNLTSLKLTVNIPRLHESYFASWHAGDEDAAEDGWHITLPLVLDGCEIGKLLLGGRSSGNAALPEMQNVLEFLEPLEEQLRRLAESIDAASAGVAEMPQSAAMARAAIGAGA